MGIPKIYNVNKNETNNGYRLATQQNKNLDQLDMLGVQNNQLNIKLRVHVIDPPNISFNCH